MGEATGGCLQVSVLHLHNRFDWVILFGDIFPSYFALGQKETCIWMNFNSF